MAEEILQKIIETINVRAVDQFNIDVKYMESASGGIVMRDKNSPNINIKVNTVACPDKEVLRNLSAPENQQALKEFTDSVIKSQDIGNAFNNVALPVEVVEFISSDVNSATAQCLKNYSASEAKDAKKIARR